jgi:PAS domain S-box-containing protein
MQKALDSLLQALPSPAYIFDVATLEVRAANTAFLVLMGYIREELIGMSVEGFRPAEDVPALRHALSQPPPEQETPWCYLTKDGTLLHVNIIYLDMELIESSPTPMKARLVIVSSWHEK